MGLRTASALLHGTLAGYPSWMCSLQPILPIRCWAQSGSVPSGLCFCLASSGSKFEWHGARTSQPLPSIDVVRAKKSERDTRWERRPTAGSRYMQFVILSSLSSPSVGLLPLHHLYPHPVVISLSWEPAYTYVDRPSCYSPS